MVFEEFEHIGHFYKKTKEKKRKYLELPNSKNDKVERFGKQLLSTLISTLHLENKCQTRINWIVS